ncbi:MAG: hypothetical protein H7336_00880 [Bacteriovorax sp.]|nr:hypothetical protein [Bacteriovorax sp.]
MIKVIDMLKTKYDIHCAILYGSRTTEAYFSDSDYDILSIRTSGDRIREVFSFDNKVVDLIVDTGDLIHSPENYMYLWSSQILLDENGFGVKLLEAHRNYLNQPALKLPPNRIIQRKKQIKDELKYIKRGGELGHYRHHDLLAKILPLYFNLIGEWYLGDKHALNWLKLNRPDLFSTFAQAFQLI